MNEELSELIVAYGTKEQVDVLNFLDPKSKQDIIDMLLALTTEYFNDKNSSSLREHLLVTLGGFIRREEKIGYNGYRQASIQGSTYEFCEAKPTNVITKNGRVTRKLNGGGNFTDFTWNRLEKHVKDNPTMLMGGFVDGKLLYAMQFKFNSSRGLYTCLEEQLKKSFPNGDEPGRYLRSARFNLNHYSDSPELSILYPPAPDVIEENSGYMTGNLKSYLLDMHR